jgi:hypothetical protein
VSRTGAVIVGLDVAAASDGVIPGIGAGGDTDGAPTASGADEVGPGEWVAAGRCDRVAMTAKYTPSTASTTTAAARGE